MSEPKDWSTEFDEDDIEAGKTMAILAYVFPCCINWVSVILAFVKKDNDFHIFHARQSLGLAILTFALMIPLTIVSVVGGMIPGVGFIISIVVGLISLVVLLGILALMVIGILNAMKPEYKALPVVGDMLVEKLSFLKKAE